MRKGKRRLGLREKLQRRAIDLRQAQEPSFSREQYLLSQMFGGGEHFLGLPEGESETRTTINNDLHPSLNNNPNEEQTSDIFGFGGQGERSGLF